MGPAAGENSGLPKNAAKPAFTLNEALQQWLGAGRPVAEATVVDASGAAPVPVGGRMIIAGEEDFHGSVSGGCVEADVIVAALDVLASGKPATLTFGISDDVAWRSGLACGSTIRVYVRPLSPVDAALVGDAAKAVSLDRRARVIATSLECGRSSLFTMDDDKPAAVAEVFRSGLSTLATYDDSAWFLHSLTPPPRIVAIGATHVAQMLHHMATAIGYDMVVIDPRSAFTAATRFDSDAAITGWPEANLQAFADDPYTAIVTLTHVGHIDDEALTIALRARCRYVGALGSRRTHAARVARLAAAGLGDAELARIHAPVGLDLGGRTPGEIAVAILCEVVAAFNGKLPQ